jgi:Cd2+/Zn2+-exporting ATPase
MSKKDCCGDSAPENSTAKSVPSERGEVSVFRVLGMDCADEVGAIQKALAGPKIFSINANIMASTVTVQHDSGIGVEEISRMISSTGVRVAKPDQEQNSIGHVRVALVAASGLFTALGFLADYFNFPGVAEIALNTIAVLSGGSLIFPKAFRAIRRVQLDMNVLMTVAVVGAFAIGEYIEAASVVFLFSLSELLEAFSVARARRAIKEVLDLAPKFALRVLENGAAEEISLDEVKTGYLLLVKSGEKIPVDGTVEEGSSLVNQAPLTGESVPVEKRPGDEVFGGTVNENSVLKIRVTADFSDSKVSQVIRLIEDAQKDKAPAQRFVDSFAKVYTPLVFLAALGVFLLPPLLAGGEWHEWLYRSLVLLVVACPCALVLSTPVSIVSGLTAMARKGVLVKGGTFLETLGKIRAIAVDKTGTITEGKPKVQAIHAINGTNEEKIIQIAASVEQLSSHPLAEAVVQFAREKNIRLSKATDFKNIVGKGAEAVVDGHQYFMGNHRFAHELGVCTPELENTLQKLEQEALSVIVVGHRPHSDCAGEVFGVLALGDPVRKNSAKAVKALKDSGIQHVVMLSGDNQKTASAIAAKVGIEEVRGDLLPEDKVREIKALTEKYGEVAMIGDGINDAPALAVASIGIAMGAAGTDTALETSDVALMRDDLEQVATAVKQGRRALNIIRFNIGLALAIKAAFLVLAFFGHTSLWLAVAADTGTSLLVIANAMRLLRA